MSWLVLATFVAAVAVPASAQVVMDGTLGRAGALSGPAFLVTSDLGRQVGGTLGRAGALSGPAFQVTSDLGWQVGGNLFHSFSKLNLTAGESVTFSGPASVQNVLARVTGGASSIDGTLRSTIAGANLYLLNPGGVMFGPNARVDVSGSFVVSTADYVKLADGGRFDARRTANSALTAAPLAKFGFLSMAPAKITVDGSQLVVANRQTLTLVGGDLELKNGALVKAPQGTVNLTSVGAVPTKISAAPELTDLPAGGIITLSTGASVDVSGEGGGLAVIRSRDLTVDNASVRANTTGGLDGRGIDVQLGGAGVLRNRGVISTQTTGSGRAGAIGIVANSLEILLGGQINSSTAAAGDAAGVTLRANALTIDGRGQPDTGIFSDSKASATGKAGDVTVRVAGLLQVLNLGSISTDTVGAGKGGRVDVTAGALTVAGALTMDGGASRYFTFISSDSNPGATGSAGDVIVEVRGLLKVLTGGSITSDTSGAGSAGKVAITAVALTIDGGTRTDFTGISSETLVNPVGSAPPTGRAGDVNVGVTGLLKVLNGGKISSATSGAGKAGTVEITAGALTIDGGTREFTGISSDSNKGATGHAGDVKVEVSGLLQVVNGGLISSDTSNLGNAGKLTVSAGALTIDGRSSQFFTGISSDSVAGATGNAGAVEVKVRGLLQVLNSGVISSDTSGAGNAGKLTVTAGALKIAGGNRDFFTGISSDSNAGATGNAGDVDVAVIGLLQLLNSGQISSGTADSGSGGSVRVQAHDMLLDQSAAVTAASTGSGIAGQVQIQATGAILLRDNSSISSKSDLSRAGGVVVQAGTRLELYHSRITTEASQGDGGELRLTATERIHLDHSHIFSQASGSGGNIFIDPVTVSLNQSTISANASAGNGGNITINTGYLLRSQDSRITATSQFGVNGQISVLGASVDLSGSLVTLPGGLLAADSRLPERCAVRLPGNLSSFISVGRGGLPLEPQDYQPMFLLLDERKETTEKRP